MADNVVDVVSVFDMATGEPLVVAMEPDGAYGPRACHRHRLADRASAAAVSSDAA